MSCFRLSLVFAYAIGALTVAPASAELIYGSFNNSNDVVSFDTANTGTLISNYPLSGPPPATISDVILGLAVHSDTGQLYGVSGTGVYTIDPNTGVKTLVAPSPLTAPFDMAAGASFQPGTGNLFVTSSTTNDLLEVNVATGVTTNLGRLAFAPTDANAAKTLLSRRLHGVRRPAGQRPRCMESTQRPGWWRSMLRTGRKPRSGRSPRSWARDRVRGSRIPS